MGTRSKVESGWLEGHHIHNSRYGLEIDGHVLNNDTLHYFVYTGEKNAVSGLELGKIYPGFPPRW